MHQFDYFENLRATMLTFLTFAEIDSSTPIMKRNSLLLLVLPFILFGFDGKLNQANTTSKKWVRLFNGKNLDGWKMKIAGFPLGENFGNTFRVENGILRIRYDQYGDNFNSRFGALYHAKKLTTTG
jgi:hypothetical protein